MTINIDKILERVLRMATTKLGRYDLDAMLNEDFPVVGVDVLGDHQHLRHRDPLRYVILMYRGYHIGTVYRRKVCKDGHHLDPDISKRIWDAVQSYHIPYSEK